MTLAELRRIVEQLITAHGEQTKVSFIYPAGKGRVRVGRITTYMVGGLGLPGTAPSVRIVLDHARGPEKEEEEK